MTNSKIRLLVVDDDVFVSRAVQRHFSRASVDVVVTIAESGQQALQLLSAGTYDFILCDFSMPEMMGYELLEAVRTSYPSMIDHFLFHTANEEEARPYGVPVISKGELHRIQAALGF